MTQKKESGNLRGNKKKKTLSVNAQTVWIENA